MTQPLIARLTTKKYKIIRDIHISPLEGTKQVKASCFHDYINHGRSQHPCLSVPNDLPEPQQLKEAPNL